MKKLYARVTHWIKTIGYSWNYNRESVAANISRDQKALELSIQYAIAPEKARKLVDVADSLDIPDSILERLICHAIAFLYDSLDFPLNMMLHFRHEFERKEIKFPKKGQEK